ncbi:N-acyl-D-amino-acid deacylase family protein [Chromatocurvus halotolerans]|uniref:N-acyl-D-amino-acid deacylase n=1 Tax=Chromatocurvus halotolerans TaxID=1132028 RepID=A0A4R2KQG5_9GAMM|nr:D-aminoacylase [Chromatocurvus halotolerans]TCO75854.1 N-acyl-D-amino-acid deacylase [Chromatocurvus halotolerans]
MTLRKCIPSLFSQRLCAALLLNLAVSACAEQASNTNGKDAGQTADNATHFDLIIAGGTVYDGSGGEAIAADIAVRNDLIAAIGNDIGTADERIDASGKAVAPGFINMLSWANESLIEDGRSLSDIRQGITLEVFGEGWSMGPLNDTMKADMLAQQGDIHFDIAWTTLGEYLDYLTERGISPNVASFVGATTVRMHVLGEDDVDPTSEELATMQELVREAMREGALGVGSSLIYAPAFYAGTDELVALMQASAEFDGRYISHMRSEGNRLLESVDELIEIAERAGTGAEIYHLKASGEKNWDKMDAAIERIEAARERGLDITANMYTYTAGATGLDASMPPWVQAGGLEQWIARLRDPEIRERLRSEIATPSDDWENLYLSAGGADRVLLIGFRNPALKPLTGMSLAAVAEQRGTSPIDTMMDLVIEDGSRVDTVYFMMSEENVRKKIAQPWMSFGSDAASMAPEGAFLLSSTHPRAYGNFARLLGNYVREEKVITLSEAIRRLTTLPAGNLKLRERGSLEVGHYADIVVFDPDTVTDPATFDNPQQLARGVSDVVVNGVPVLRDGMHTGALPGRVVRGPGYSGETGGY